LAKGRLDDARADALLYAEHHPRVLAVVDASSALDLYDEQRQRGLTDEAFARAAGQERQGRLREAFDEYGRAYAWAPAGDERIARAEQALVRLYPRLERKPELPEAARRFFVEAEDRVKREDYAGASEAFARVSGVVPWYAQAYYNRALVLERLERFAEAARTMQRFLDLAPDSRHARAARDRLYVWQSRATVP
jgi:tetratricopeptide (TPR) repeat protein